MIIRSTFELSFDSAKVAIKTYKFRKVRISVFLNRRRNMQEIITITVAAEKEMSLVLKI